MRLPLIRSLFGVSIVLIAGLSFSALANKEACQHQMVATSTESDGSNFLISQAEGQHDLRVFHTPTLYQLNRLGYEHIGHVNRRKILLMGDGFSGLALALMDAGKDVTSVDPAYAEEIDTSGLNEAALYMIGQYAEKMQGRLMPVSAQNTGLEKGHYQLILSHMLLNNIPSDEIKARVIIEAASLLRANGEARFVAWNRDTNPDILKDEVRNGPVVGAIKYLQSQGLVKPGKVLKFSQVQDEWEDGNPYYHVYYSVRFIRTSKRRPNQAR